MEDDKKTTKAVEEASSAPPQAKNSTSILLDVTLDTLDMNKLQSDTNELDRIENEFPHDMIVDIGNAEHLSGLAIRAISICDYWIPVLTVLISELEVISAKARAEAYLNAESPKNGKLTADVRKQVAEADPEFTKARQNVARYEAIQERLKLKSKTFEKVHYSMKDQQKTYNSPIAGRHISGEEQVFKNSIKNSSSSSPSSAKPQKSGEENW